MTSMNEPMDVVGPWTIKAVPTEIRNKVMIAARQEGLTVGQWLERRVNEWTEDGGPVRVRRELVPVSPGQPRLETRADIAELGELVRMARELTPEGKQTQVMQTARAAVQNRLKSMGR
jgi:hypothetical protein